MGKLIRLASIALLGTGLYLGAQLEAKRLSFTECSKVALANIAGAEVNSAKVSANGIPFVNMNMEVRVPSYACELLHGNGLERTAGVVRFDILSRVTGENPASTAIKVGQTDADLEAQKKAVNDAIERNKTYVAEEAVSGLFPELNPFKQPGAKER